MYTFPLLPWKGVALNNVTTPIAFPRWLAAWSACTSFTPTWTCPFKQSKKKCHITKNKNLIK